jgi:hypothetical protein
LILSSCLLPFGRLAAKPGAAELVDEHAPTGRALTAPRGLSLDHEVEDLAAGGRVEPTLGNP